MTHEEAVNDLNVIKEFFEQQSGAYPVSLEYAIKVLKSESSADRPQGEWIFKTVFPNDKSEFPMGYLVCSVCGSHHHNSTPCNYCDNCGARMKGADDE